MGGATSKFPPQSVDLLWRHHLWCDYDKKYSFCVEFHELSESAIKIKKSYVENPQKQVWRNLTWKTLGFCCRAAPRIHGWMLVFKWSIHFSSCFHHSWRFLIKYIWLQIDFSAVSEELGLVGPALYPWACPSTLTATFRIQLTCIRSMLWAFEV